MTIFCPPRQTFGRIIARNAHARPEHVALECGQRQLTNAEYLENSLRVASALYREGCRPGDRVASLCLNSLEQVEIQGACELAGFISVSLNFRLAPAELLFQMGDCLPRFFLYQTAYAELVEQIRDLVPGVTHWIMIGGEGDDYAAFRASGDAAGPPCEAREDDVAYIIYSSGTTGRPKGCMLGHARSLNTIISCSADLEMSRMDRTLLVMPMFHIGAKCVQLATQWQDATSLLVERFDPGEWLRLVAERKVSVGHLAPTMIQDILRHPAIDDHDLSSLRIVLYSAAAMPVPVLRTAMEKLGPVLHQEYGMTEGAGTSLHRREHDPDGDEAALRRLYSIGLPMTGVEVRIADDHGNEVARGTPGEIQVRSNGLMLGYWNDTTATAEAMRDGWFRTGDIGRQDVHGYFYLVDRKKDMIISGGENIYSREVEEALFKHPHIVEAAVIGVPDAQWGEAVRAVVVTVPGHPISEDDVVAHCRELLASYKKPRSVVFTDALPRLGSGKIDKISVRKAFGAAAIPVPRPRPESQ